MNPNVRGTLVTFCAVILTVLSSAGTQAAPAARWAPLQAASGIAMPTVGGIGVPEAKTLSWPVLGFDPGLSGYNPHETVLSPANVPNLQQTWSSSTGEPVALIEDKGLVFVQSTRGSTAYVTAVRTSDGTQAWTSPINNWSYSPGLAAGSGLVFSTCASSDGAGALCAFHESTGKLRWSISFDCHCGPNGAVMEPPIYDRGAVYFLYSPGGCCNHFDFAAVDARNGNMLWNIPLGYAAYFPSPAVANGIVYASCGASNFAGLCALNASDGTQLWAYSSGSNVYTGGGQAVANGVVYFVEDISNGSYSYEQTLTALNATTGAVLWTFTRPDNANGYYSSQPAVAKGRVYWAASDNTLYALNAKTGTLVWSQNQTCRGIQSSPSVANGVVYASPGCGDIVAVDARTGAILRQPTGGGAGGPPPIVLNGTVYAQCGNLCAYNVPGSLRRTNSSPRAMLQRAVLIRQ